MGRAGELMIRVNFAGTDRLSRMLDSISGKSRAAARDIADTNKALGAQKAELRDVQRQMAAANDNTGHLVAREHELQESIAATNRRFEQQKKVIAINARTERAAAVGSNLVASGRAGLFSALAEAAPIYAIAKAGADFQALQNRMKVLGLGDGAVKELTAYAQAMDVAGSATKDNMRYLLEAQGAFRETGEHSAKEQLAGAKLMAPILAKMHVVDKGTGKSMSEEEERYMLRFVEQAGGLSDPKRAKQLADGVFRARQSSGGNVNFANYQGFLAAAGSAGTHLSNRSMFADFEPLIAELHEQAGVGLASAYNRASGITKNAAAAKDFMKLGIWDPSKVVLNGMGGVKEFKGNPLAGKANQLLARDPVEFYRQIVLPAYGRAGIKGEEVTRQNQMLFGRGGGKLFNLIDKQLPTLLKSRESFKRTQGVDQAYGTTKDSFDGKMAQLKAAGSNFMVAASMKGGLLENVTSLLGSATVALKSFTAWGNANPGAFRWIGKIAVDLILLRGAIAIAKIAFGGLLGPAFRLWGVFSKLHAAGGFAKAFPLLARVARVAGSGLSFLASGAMKLGGAMIRFLPMAFGIARTAVLFLARGVMQAGAMMLANPMVLAIVALGAALVGVGYLIYRNWDTIKAAFWAGVAAIGQAMGGIGGFLGRAWAGVKAAFFGVIAWVTGIAGRFYAAGANIMRGLVNGISNGLASVKNAIVGAAGSAIGWFKAKLGIHSPSRVFHGFGGFLMQGLANGIDAGADQPLRRIAALARGATGAMAMVATPAFAAHAPALASRIVASRPISAPRASAATAPAAAAPAPITIQIFGAPGQSEEALARLVEAKLRQLGLVGGASSRRASYRDDPDGADL